MVPAEPWVGLLPQTTNWNYWISITLTETFIRGWWCDVGRLSHSINIQQKGFLASIYWSHSIYCWWLIHIYNDQRFALTSSPLQRVYYWNANSTISVMILLYNAHIWSTYANGLKKPSSYIMLLIWMCHHTLSSNHIRWWCDKEFCCYDTKEGTWEEKVQYSSNDRLHYLTFTNLEPLSVMRKSNRMTKDKDGVTYDFSFSLLS